MRNWKSLFALVLALMMLAALVIVSRVLLTRMRENRAALTAIRKGGEAA